METGRHRGDQTHEWTAHELTPRRRSWRPLVVVIPASAQTSLLARIGRLGETWNVPLNLTYSKVTRLGSQTISFAGGARYYFDTPGDGPDWGLRFVATLLFAEH